MAKTGKIVPDYCTGWRQCELVPSWVQTETVTPSHSLIRVNAFIACLEIATCRVVSLILQAHDRFVRPTVLAETRRGFPSLALLHGSGGGTTTCS